MMGQTIFSGLLSLVQLFVDLLRRWSWLVHTLKVELEGCPYEQEGLDVYVSAGCTPDDFTSNRRIAIFLQHCAAVSEFNKVLEPLVAFLVVRFRVDFWLWIIH